MITVKMIYFAQARECTGTRSEDFSFEGQPKVRAVVLKAFDAHPSLSKLEKALKVALNEEITEDNVPLHDGDRVALLPPVVGG